MPRLLAGHFWWRRVDSNHRSRRQQIYSLPPLATRELLRMKLGPAKTPDASAGRKEGDHRESGPLLKMELVDGFEPPTC